ncbi:MAG TPA: acyltransferase [Lacunisphaera sp.]|jgi:peptidoglycan/LPS O-acetylase OafA/YrhL
MLSKNASSGVPFAIYGDLNSIKRGIAKQSAFYRPELDALRFFAFLAVFITHVLPTARDYYSSRMHLPRAWATLAVDIVRSGGTGVVLFFMLSSYLITSLLIREHNQTGTIKIVPFYIRRALRIWPLYFAFLLVCFFVFPMFGLPHTPVAHIVGFVTFTENWVLIFDGHIKSTALHLWSVSVEEQFYLIWPVLIVTVGISRIRWLAMACIIIAFCSRELMAARGSEALWFATTSHIDSIAVGALIASVRWDDLGRLSRLSRLLMFIAGVSIPVVGGIFSADDGRWYYALVRYPADTLGCALILLSILGWGCGGSLLIRTLVYLGKISYGLYVFHIVFFWLLNAHGFPVTFVVTMSFLCTVFTAAISYHCLELPFLKLKSKFSVVESRTCSSNKAV